MEFVKEINEINEKIKPYLKSTPIVKEENLSNLLKGNVYLKLENLQRTGSFKIRGAANKLLKTNALNVLGVSAGNHAQGVAYMARELNKNCTIIMPETAPLAKIKATRDYGAEVILVGQNYDEAYKYASKIKDDFELIHAFDDLDIIKGQATIGIDILKKNVDFDQIIIPIGGGGLSSGIARYIKAINPKIKIIGVQTELTDAMSKSFEKNELVCLTPNSTIADGINVGKPGVKTFDLIKNHVDGIVTVSEDEIAKTILYLLEECKIVVEGAGAVSVAALMHGKIVANDKNTCCVVSGGNIDMSLIESIINHGMIAANRRFKISVIMQDKSGELLKLLQCISLNNANISTINQRKGNNDLKRTDQCIEIVIDCFDNLHKQIIIEEITKAGYEFA